MKTGKYRKRYLINLSSVMWGHFGVWWNRRIFGGFSAGIEFGVNGLRHHRNVSKLRRIAKQRARA